MNSLVQLFILSCSTQSGKLIHKAFFISRGQLVLIMAVLVALEILCLQRVNLDAYLFG
jgi:hypothetical protein